MNRFAPGNARIALASFAVLFSSGAAYGGDSCFNCYHSHSAGAAPYVNITSQNPITVQQCCQVGNQAASYWGQQVNSEVVDYDRYRVTVRSVNPSGEGCVVLGHHWEFPRDTNWAAPIYEWGASGPVDLTTPGSYDLVVKYNNNYQGHNHGRVGCKDTFEELRSGLQTTTPGETAQATVTIVVEPLATMLECDNPVPTGSTELLEVTRSWANYVGLAGRLLRVVNPQAPNLIPNVSVARTWHLVANHNGGCGENITQSLTTSHSVQAEADIEVSAFSLLSGSMQIQYQYGQGAQISSGCTHGGNCRFARLELYQEQVRPTFVAGAFEVFDAVTGVTEVVNDVLPGVWLTSSMTRCCYSPVSFVQ